MTATPVSLSAARAFAATRWSLVAAAGGDDAPQARNAMIELCLRYWFPVYAYVRGCGHDTAVARDITRGFFEQVLQDRVSLPEARARGRFRQYLLEALHRYLGGDWRQAVVSDAVAEFEQPQSWDELEARYREEAALGRTPEQNYQRIYALEVLGNALARLRSEATQAGRLAMFDALERWLSQDPAPGECDLAAQRLHIRPLAVVVALKRLRQRYRELAEAELCETVASAEDLAAERDALARALDGD